MEFKIAENLSIIGILTYPKCGAVSEHNLSEKQAGDSIACRCRAWIQITDDGFAAARWQLLEFQNFIKRGGK